MIIDASVVTAWFVEIETSGPARPLRLLRGLSAPDLLRVELASALLKYVRVGRFPGEQVFRSVDRTQSLIEHWISDANLLSAAIDIALSHNHKIYDCLYLALALERREPLATADRRLAAVARNLSIETELIEPAL